MAETPIASGQPDNIQKGAAPVARCLACGQPEQLVWVHGHGQCAHSYTNVMPCCDGAVCDSDKE